MDRTRRESQWRNPELIDHVRAIKTQHPDWGWKRIARELNLTYWTVRQIAMMLESSSSLSSSPPSPSFHDASATPHASITATTSMDVARDFMVRGDWERSMTFAWPKNGGPRPESPPTIVSEHALVLCDLHVPYHNILMLDRACTIVQKHFAHIEDIIIAGDYWDFGMISRFPKDEQHAWLDEEIEIAGHIGRILFALFKRCYILKGNHDARLAKRLNTPLHMRHLFSMAFGRTWPSSEFIFSESSYAYLDNNDGDPYRNWIIGHPASYHQRGGQTPADIADIEHRNVATGHNHIIGMQQSKSGRYIGIDIGHCTEPRKHAYAHHALTKFTRWNAGFLIIEAGYPYHFTERTTNWRYWGVK